MSGYLRSISFGFLWKGKLCRSHIHWINCYLLPWFMFLWSPHALCFCFFFFSIYLWYFGCKRYTCWKHYLIPNDSAIANLLKTTNTVNVIKVDLCKAKSLMSITWHSGLGDHLCGKPLEYFLQSPNVLHTNVRKCWSTCHIRVRIFKSSVTLIKKIRLRFANPELNLKQFHFCRQVAILHPSGVLPSASTGLWFYTFVWTLEYIYCRQITLQRLSRSILT